MIEELEEVMRERNIGVINIKYKDCFVTYLFDQNGNKKDCLYMACDFVTGNLIHMESHVIPYLEEQQEMIKACNSTAYYYESDITLENCGTIVR